MKLGITSFRGEAPLITPRALPANGAQLALNARLVTGDLTAWRQFLSEKALANTGPVQTIYKLKDKWLSWNDQVDVARGLVPGDETYLTYLTCPSLYGRPQFTNYTMATTGAEPYPVTTRPLGVDAPQVAPTLTLGVDTSDEANFSVDVQDNGDQLGTWATSGVVTEATFNSSVTQDGSIGSPAVPSYRIAWRDYEHGTFMKKNFNIADAAVASMSCRVRLNSVANRSMVFAGVMRNEDGTGGLSVRIDQVTPGVFNTSIGTGANWSQGQDQSTLVNVNLSSFAADTFFKWKIDVVRNLDNTIKATSTVSDLADVVLGTITTTMSAELGDWCGFGGGFDQLGSTNTAHLDDIRVTASGTFGFSPVTSATSYVFTYRNDLAQESAPSPVTATVLRPDGVAVTITTPTTLPGGYSVYGITEKVIYRAVTGDGGTVFKQVAVIPLATADFVDTLADQNTGPAVLESADWDLPPANLEGIITLPNDCMAGFFGNQLCFSAQGFPHAWPVKYRKTTDTKIVAIANIDTTVVVGTQSYVYTATGSSPDAYSMSKPGEKQACLSKLGMVYLDEVGVVFPSPDGWQLCAGVAGAVRNLTGSIFTKIQWMAQNPSSFIAAVQDGVLHWFYNSDVGVIGWFAPIDSSDATTASPSNSGSNDNTSSFSDIRPHMGLVPYNAGATSVVVWSLDSWVPVDLLADPPAFNGLVAGQHGTQEVQPAFFGGFELADGVAKFKVTVDGVLQPGRLALTMYHNGDTGGYGGMSWEYLP